MKKLPLIDKDSFLKQMSMRLDRQIDYPLDVEELKMIYCSHKLGVKEKKE